ncbi:hypothetical protein [Rhodovarius crocodyli]|nr:hypothetical protein [Rhodovarius crocodyli]
MSSVVLSSLLAIDLPSLLAAMAAAAGVALNILMPADEETLAVAMRCC